LVSPYVDLTGPAPGSTSAGIVTWDQTTQSEQPTALPGIITASGIKSIHLAFVVNDSAASKPCTPTWGGYDTYLIPPGPNYPATTFGVAIMKSIAASGTSVIVSFGGANGTYLAQSCTSPAALAVAYEQVIQAFNPVEINFDFETSSMVQDKVSIDRAMNALNLVHQNHPNLFLSFTLAVLPQGLQPGSGLLVAQEAWAILQPQGNFSIDLMTMDYGDTPAPPGQKTMGQYAIDAVNATRSQLNAMGATNVKIGFIPMIGLNDDPKENFTLADAAAIAAFAKANSWINLLSFWSINRDAPCSNPAKQLYCTSLDPTTGTPNQTTEYAYIAALINGSAVQSDSKIPKK